ncbi:MAG: hypothetical protein V4850_22850 [Myxococcota bacterium]
MIVALLACVSNDQSSGASEPVQVRAGTFQPGELPTDDSAASPNVIYVSSVGYVVTQGDANAGYSGLASTEAYSIAVAVPDVGSGYWVVPVDGPDVTEDNNLLFDLTVDFTREVPYGLQTISFVALDEGGHPGPRYDATLCVLPDYADKNYAACDPETPPQHTILSLSWDTDVDLDLVVVTPAGKVVRSESASTQVDPIASDGDTSTEGVLTRDSNSNCVIDSVRLESLVFEEEPPAGDYEVYASLFSPCGERSVNYALSLFERVDEADGSWSVAQEDVASGALLAAQADGGASLGTHVTTLTLP